MNDKKIQIILADDHPLMLDGLKTIILGYPQFDLIGAAQDGAQALSLIAGNSPEVAVLDIDMPFLTGLEVVEKCKAANLLTRFILLTFHKEEALYQKAKELGVFGYVLKDQSRQEIVQCILQVAKGEHYISKSLESLLDKKVIPSELESLTKTELAVVKLIAKNKTSNDIADMLFVSKKTIENHRANVCKKLNLDGSKNSLLSWALKHREVLIQ